MPTSITPQITLTATLQDIAGVAAGSTASPAVLRIALTGFGLTLPCIVGTSNLVRVGPEDFYDDGSGVSTPLWGNDVITPGGTFYAITLLDGDGNILQCARYQFVGSGTIDLSAAPPYNPPPVTPTGPTYFADDVVPTPAIDGTTAIFFLPQVPNPQNSLNFFKDGTRLTAGIGFHLVGNKIIYEADYVPQVGDSHIANYRFSF
jgi:hypothetical protein